MHDNPQTPEKRQTFSSLGHNKLDVHSIFYTIQGEGPFAGTPAVFVRLAGCNLQCPKCDTEYTLRREWLTVEDICLRIRQATIPKAETDFALAAQHLDQMDALKEFRGLVVITGGEPFRQQLDDLLIELVQRGYFVQIETNGTLPPPEVNMLFSKNTSIRRGVYIVVSPKAGRVHPKTADIACAYKYVMSTNSIDPADGLPIYALDHSLGSGLRVARPLIGYAGPVYLQPMDEQDPDLNERHLRSCITSCMKHGYILQLQIHKIIRME